jgi:hypothetical protein
MKECIKCGLIKNWNGDDPNCPFQSSETFGENWNCGIINKVRDICDAAIEGKDHRLHYQYCEDQKYVTINIDQVENDEGDFIGLCLWVTWYKSRGATDAMWILSSNENTNPRKPTFMELGKIIDHYAEYCSERCSE